MRRLLGCFNPLQSLLNHTMGSCTQRQHQRLLRSTHWLWNGTRRKRKQWLEVYSVTLQTWLCNKESANTPPKPEVPQDLTETEHLGWIWEVSRRSRSRVQRNSNQIMMTILGSLNLERQYTSNLPPQQAQGNGIRSLYAPCPSLWAAVRRCPGQEHWNNVWVHIISRNGCTEVGTSSVRQCLASIRVSVTTALLTPALTQHPPPCPHCIPWHCLAPLHACGVKMASILSSPIDFSSAKISSIVLFLSFFSREK